MYLDLLLENSFQGYLVGNQPGEFTNCIFEQGHHARSYHAALKTKERTDSQLLSPTSANPLLFTSAARRGVVCEQCVDATHGQFRGAKCMKCTCQRRSNDNRQWGMNHRMRAKLPLL